MTTTSTSTGLGIRKLTARIGAEVTGVSPSLDDGPPGPCGQMISQEAAVTPHGTRAGISVLAEDLVRRCGGRAVLDHLWLEIAASELVVLLGPPGCGKTTLLRLLGGLDPPDAGSVSVPRSRAIVFQGARLLSWEWMWQNVTTGLSERVGAWPRTLSGGEARRADLAPARVPDPALVLLDEPFAALDAITRLRMHGLVRALRDRRNAAILLVTRDVDDAIALADRILIMREGRIGSQHQVALSSPDRSRGLAREELRANLLVELGADRAGVRTGGRQ